MAAIKSDSRSRESMAADKGGEWSVKRTAVKGRNARKREAAGAPKQKFATIDGKRVEVRQARPTEARPYPPAPVTARPGSRIAVTLLRGHSDPGIPKLPRRAIGPKLDVARSMNKREQSNNLPFVPEFIAEGQPFPRMARDQDGNVMPRVRTDNGLTDRLKRNGIQRRDHSLLTKRQAEAREREREARHATAMEVVRLRDIADTQDRLREEAKRGLQHFMGIEREALARGDMDVAAHARESIRAYRKAAKYKG